MPAWLTRAWARAGAFGALSAAEVAAAVSCFVPTEKSQMMVRSVPALHPLCIRSVPLCTRPAAAAGAVPPPAKGTAQPLP